MTKQKQANETGLELWQASAKLTSRRNPSELYLVTLAETGRYTMQRRLRGALVLLLGGQVTELPEGAELQAPWEKLRRGHVEAVKTALQERGLAPATVNAHIYALRGVARACFDEGLMSADELKRIERVKPDRGKRLPAGRALTPGEIGALMRACEEDATAAGPRDAAIIGLLYAAGLRRAEVAALDRGDYDPEAGELVVKGKGSKERLVHVNDGAADALSDWLAIRGDEAGSLFLGINKGGVVQRARGLSDQGVHIALKKRARQAQVNEVTPHDLRRTFVSDLLLAGADISVVQRLAGHENVQTTALYDRRGEECKKQAVGLLHLPYKKRTQGGGQEE